MFYTSGHSLFSREKRALLVAGPVAPFFARRGEPAAAASRLGGARVAGRRFASLDDEEGQVKHKGLAALRQKGEALKQKGEGIAMKLATATKAAATSVTTTRPRGTDEEKSSLAGDDEEGEGAKPRRRRKRRDRPVPEDGEHDEVRAAVASMVSTVLADVARLKDVQKLREEEALCVESLRARLAAAELEEKIAAERLRELQDRDAAQLIQDL